MAATGLESRSQVSARLPSRHRLAGSIKSTSSWVVLAFITHPLHHSRRWTSVVGAATASSEGHAEVSSGCGASSLGAAFMNATRAAEASGADR
jgi:hypothetical protein